MQIVWFKRDLRIVDHFPLLEASKRGSVLPLYILEPNLWKLPDMSERHYRFLCDSLNTLNQSLKDLGASLIIKIGEVIAILKEIHLSMPIEAIWSHQETGNAWTYERDLDVQKWSQMVKIPWYQFPHNGVTRGLKNRDGWSVKWQITMKQTISPKPNQIEPTGLLSDTLPTASTLGLENDPYVSLQAGGRFNAMDTLNSFLYKRGETYTKEMSSPVTAFESCSRLSTHLAFGTISIREVFQAYESRREMIKSMPKFQQSTWLSALRSFSGRLRWHCHFIQKLEDEPRIEKENMHPAYDDLRKDNFNNEFFQAWQQGKTGYPMVDACMRALLATGWLNFRMRAMLMSFASYHLWLHWRQPSLHLAKLFTDYEPGIHYSQSQMQSGTTGINAIRIYNPIKQGLDQDPDGTFIRQWIPELRSVPKTLIHTPWLSSLKPKNYPDPIVEEKTARKFAADKLYGLRKQNPDHRDMAKKIFLRHGSRKSTSQSTKKSKQIELDL